MKKLLTLLFGCLLLAGCPKAPPVVTPPPPAQEYVRVTWDPSPEFVTNNTWYRVYRGVFDGTNCGLPVLYADSIVVATYNDLKITSGTTYCYGASLVDSANKNESPMSNVVSVVVK